MQEATSGLLAGWQVFEGWRRDGASHLPSSTHAPI